MLILFIFLGTIFLTALVPIAVIEAFKMISNFPFAYKEGKCGFLTFITGSYLAPQNCKVIFDCKPNDGCISVCNVMSFTIKVGILLKNFQYFNRFNFFKVLSTQLQTIPNYSRRPIVCTYNEWISIGAMFD